MGDGLPAAGDVFDGYEVVEEVARGGMGVVYLVHNPTLRRDEAMKILWRDGDPSERSEDRFRREMELVASLRHPNILQVHAARSINGRLWFTMPFVRGVNAEGWLAAHQPDPPIGTVLYILTAIAEALDYAHDRNIVHRDVKPANVLIETADARDGPLEQVYLADFGIAKVVTKDSVPLTETGQALGTWQYAAPEQFEGGGIQPRTDIYALGAMAFHLLTGSKPFPADDFVSNWNSRASKLLPSALERRPDLTPAVDTVIRQAMSVDPQHRFRTAGELAAALRDSFASPQSAVRGRSPSTASRVTVLEPSQSERPQHSPPPRRHRWRSIALAAAVTVLLAVGGVGTWLSTRAADAQQSDAAAASPSPYPATPTTDLSAYLSSWNASASSAAALLPTPITRLISPAPTVDQVEVAGGIAPAAAVVALSPRTCPGDSGSIIVDLSDRFSSVTGFVGLVDGVPADVRTGLWIERDGRVTSGGDPDYRLEPGIRTTLSVPVDDVDRLTLTFRTLGSGNCSSAYTAAVTTLIGTP